MGPRHRGVNLRFHNKQTAERMIRCPGTLISLA
jgi:hypothetical protein